MWRGLTPHIWKRHPEILQYIENYNYAGNFIAEDVPDPMYYESPDIIGGLVDVPYFDNMLLQDAEKFRN